jgi:hypothetical protein
MRRFLEEPLILRTRKRSFWFLRGKYHFWRIKIKYSPLIIKAYKDDKRTLDHWISPSDIPLMTIVNNPGSWGHIYPPLTCRMGMGVHLPIWCVSFYIHYGNGNPFCNAKQTVWHNYLIKLYNVLTNFLFRIVLNYFSKIELFGLEGISLLFSDW